MAYGLENRALSRVATGYAVDGKSCFPLPIVMKKSDIPERSTRILESRSSGHAHGTEDERARRSDPPVVREKCGVDVSL